MSLEQSKTRLLRSVTAADGAPPTGDSGRAEISEGRAIDVLHHIGVNVYVTLDGSAATVDLFWWDESTQTWAKDAQQTLTLSAAGTYVFYVRARGRWCQPRITTLTGTGASVRYLYPAFQGFTL